jgi:hypothetical protein
VATLLILTALKQNPRRKYPETITRRELRLKYSTGKGFAVLPELKTVREEKIEGTILNPRRTLV